MNKNWKLLKLSDIGLIVSGGTPSTKKKEYWEGNIAWITPADLTGFNKKFIAKGSRNISEIGLKESSARLLPRGAVLFSSRAPIGYVAIAENTLSTNQGFKSIIPKCNIVYSEYLYYYLKHAKELAIKAASGTTFLEISAKKFSDIQIPLPEINWQQKIVEKIDSLFAEIDAAEEKLKMLKKKLELYKQSLLNAAVRGNLVPQDPNDEPASVLIKKIKAEKEALIKAGKIKKEKPLPPIKSEEIPSDLPSGWEWVSLQELGLINPRNYISDDTNVSFIPMARILQDFSDVVHNENHTWHKVKKGFTHLAENDLVVAKITPCFENGKSCVLRGLLNGFAAGTTELHVFRDPSGLLEMKYLLLMFKNDHFISIGKTKMTGSVGHKRIPKEYFAETMIPLPPLKEQRRIVKNVFERLECIDSQAKEIISKLNKLAMLKQSILKQAFEGKLC